MAIANYIKIHNPSVNVVYATCEQLTNQLIESISRGKNDGAAFRSKYRNVDVLLLDDVQFLAKKPGTQMEFFHTFNELVLHNKQIVLTSDRSPKEIEVLEDRLRTRFEGGLLADVQPPDMETRIAILKRKAEERKCMIDMGAAFGPFLMALGTGSGEAAIWAFNQSITPEAAHFGMQSHSLGLLAILAGQFGRTASPLAGAIIIVAGMASADPLAVAKRLIPGMLVALIASAFILV